MTGRSIANCFERECRKLIIGALRFLQTNDIGTERFQPTEEPVLSLAKRINVPGGDLHLGCSRAVPSAREHCKLHASLLHKSGPAAAGLPHSKGAPRAAALKYVCSLTSSARRIQAIAFYFCDNR